MISPLRTLLRLLLFWMIFFLVQRLVFLSINFSNYKGSFGELMFANLKALPMDISASMYMIVLPALAVIAGLFLRADGLINRIIRICTKTEIVICSLIGSGDAGIYKVWGTKLNGKALSYLIYPEEVLPTLFAWENFGLFLVIIAQVLFAYWLLRKLYAPFEQPALSLPLKLATPVLITGVVIIGLRGGVQKIPVNRNWVFHSHHAVLNYAALNGFWNMADLLFQPLETQQNPYLYFPLPAAGKVVADMHYTPKDSTEKILRSSKPNIVLIFLESWTADVIRELGGEQQVAPHFSELAKEGVLFTNFYSTGYRTEQGMLATLSAYPAQPVSSIIQCFGKFDKLPNLIRVMNNQGYATSFYSGGRLQFDNVESYLHAAGVQKIMGEDDFEIRRRTVWGAYDEEVFALHLNELKEMPQPFFSSLTTMTTHEWFDADVPKVFSGDADHVNDKYRNTVHYADSCLHAYMNEARKQPWYDNTLFIVVADHACEFPRNRDNFEPGRHHIPLLWLGGAIREEYRGKQIPRVGCHVDIPATLLSQLDLDATAFRLSKNMLNPYAPAFAYYAFDNGFGFITKEKTVIYDNNQAKDLLNNDKDSLALKLRMYGMSYLETNFQQNLNYAQAQRN